MVHGSLCIAKSCGSASAKLGNAVSNTRKFQHRLARRLRRERLLEGLETRVGGGGGLIGDKVRVPLGKVEDWLGEKELS